MAQSGSATVLGTVGRWFESSCPDHFFQTYSAVGRRKPYQTVNMWWFSELNRQVWRYGRVLYGDPVMSIVPKSKLGRDEAFTSDVNDPA